MNKKAATTIVLTYIGNLLMVSIVLFSCLFAISKISSSSYHDVVAASEDTTLLLETAAMSPEMLDYYYASRVETTLDGNKLTLEKNSTRIVSYVGNKQQLSQLELTKKENAINIVKNG